MTVKVYEAKKKVLFASILIREGVGKYPAWDLSKEAREARARRKTLWEENRSKIERDAIDAVMAQTPEELRASILRKLQSLQTHQMP